MTHLNPDLYSQVYGTSKFTLKGDNRMVAKSKDKEVAQNYGIGLDVGTGFLVRSSFGAEEIEYKSIRDAFYKVDKSLFNQSMFNKNKIKYMVFDDTVYIVGDDALSFARLQNEAALRPLSLGIINPNEKSSAPILKELFRYVLEDSLKVEGERLVYSIPGPQIDNPEFDTNYHSMSIASLVGRLGNFKPEAINEAYAVIVSELHEEDQMTGIGISFGAGLVNVSFCFMGVSLFEFSIDKSGDYVDQTAANAIGESTSVVCNIKEKKLDLAKDEYSVSPEERALIFSYRYIIQNTINHLKSAFLTQKKVRLSELDALPIIVSGGTSKPKGFLKLFTKELNSADMPFEIKSIVHAKDPLRAVARGCMLWANMSD